MTHPILKRLLGAIATLIVVSLVTFVALESTLGDAATALVGDTASAAQLQTLRAEMGIDQPLVLRYGNFLSDLVFKGELGHSLISNKSVSDLLLERLPYTITLALVAAALATIIGMLIGIAAAVKAGSILDTILMSGAALGIAIPTFWSALLLMLVFSVRLRWLPVVGAEDWRYFVLPAITLALPTAAVTARLMRSSLLDVLRSDYVRTAHSKGLAPNHVLAHHVVRNSLIPVITMLGLQLGYLLGGAFIVETIFGLPGLGRLTVQAIFDRDYPIVLGTTLTVAVIFIVINFLVDLAHGWLDPQIAYKTL
ncbi:MAG: ABC transporter permease [Chloroflexi bacterium]|nr:ABC transporter permease [Chloroflexota bacterium]